MLNAGGPQAGQHGDSRAGNSMRGWTQSFARTRVRPERAGTMDSGGPGGKDVAWRLMTLPLARRIAVSFPALRHRDFTLLWIGPFLSFPGARVQTPALPCHVSPPGAPRP